MVSHTDSELQSDPEDLNSAEIEREMTAEEMRGWAEYCCWVSTVLTPILIWWNGPSVSDDQAIVRTGLIVVSVLGAIGLRIYSLILKRHTSGSS